MVAGTESRLCNQMYPGEGECSRIPALIAGCISCSDTARGIMNRNCRERRCSNRTDSVLVWLPIAVLPTAGPLPARSPGI